jgi:hypothetical protein
MTRFPDLENYLHDIGIVIKKNSINPFRSFALRGRAYDKGNELRLGEWPNGDLRLRIFHQIQIIQ